jgi:hypothetical protein
VRIAGDSGNLYLRRFGSNFTGLPWATVSGRQAVDARFPPDGAPAIQWRVQLVTSQSATVCAS